MTISIQHRSDNQLDITANGLVVCTCPTMDHAILVCTAFRLAQDWANINNVPHHPHIQEGFLKLIQYDYNQRKGGEDCGCRCDDCELCFPPEPVAAPANDYLNDTPLGQLYGDGFDQEG